ncbi:hypothetical protein YPPY45_1065, partial [Yersinia pestis PY-45]
MAILNLEGEYPPPPFFFS